MTDKELNRCHTGSFIKTAMQFELPALLDYIASEIQWAEVVPLQCETEREKMECKRVLTYRGFLLEVAYLVHMGTPPPNMADEHFQATKPLIQSLIAKGHVLPGIIDIHEMNLN